ncbi:MAG TPA: hypothetical protein PK364_07265, partial [Synergistaceae bacterium]|nr:hypothetical protein [Synergistaceae bacterium]HPJ27025.1 hypothetical protein [Synergistaceae bacterium]
NSSRHLRGGGFLATYGLKKRSAKVSKTGEIFPIYFVLYYKSRHWLFSKNTLDGKEGCGRERENEKSEAGCVKSIGECVGEKGNRGLQAYFAVSRQKS